MNHEKTTELLFDAYAALIATGNGSQLLDEIQKHIEKSGLAKLLEVYQFLKNNPTHCVEHLIRQNGYDEDAEFVCQSVPSFAVSIDCDRAKLIVKFCYNESHQTVKETSTIYVYSVNEIEF